MRESRRVDFRVITHHVKEEKFHIASSQFHHTVKESQETYVHTSIYTEHGYYCPSAEHGHLCTHANLLRL